MTTTADPAASADAASELEVHHDHDDEVFLERVLELREAVHVQSRGKLGVNADVVAALNAIPHQIGEDLIRMAIGRARSHPEDTYVLMSDVLWSRRRLLSGSGTSAWSLALTPLGGLAAGAGIPMLLAASTAPAGEVINPASIGWGTGLTVTGVVGIVVGIFLAIRRA